MRDYHPYKGIEHQIDLLGKGLMKEIISLCVISIILVPIKDGT